MSERPTVIAIEGLTKRFGEITAVDAVDLDLRENEFFALLGPSGCGKTTLLRMIAGFTGPDAGRILLDGRDMTPVRPNRRPVNLMFQSYALFPHMTVTQNIAYGLEMEGCGRDEIRRRVGEMLEMTELSPLKDRKPEHLSGGQRQRVALARALVKRPRVLLLDEPLGALDKKLREQMQLELKRMQHEVGITFVIVTHDQEEALVMADRIAVLKDGRVMQVGAPRELYEYPASRFVAGFIGKMNFFAGQGRGAEVAFGDGVLTGTAPGGVELAGPAVAAVRPERLRLAPQRPEGSLNAVPGRIVDIAYHGQDLNVHVEVRGAVDSAGGEAGARVLVRLPAGEAEEGDWQAGQDVWCCWAPAHTRVLAM
ncbi:ABC transporter ATP-binding protein [Pelagibius marinus]|uniref:ABC transporter ATP-binding protein n=1 Tax=Pelagibius marinus TaxID=2762760 RepID=UPI0018732288|nr:ABC transporter ATP-binding protein [Pelagibius marinus]